MAPLKLKGDRAEIEVARDLIRRGFRIAIPYGEDWDFDLVFARPGSETLERVQVKYATPRGDVIPVRTRSSSLTSGKVKRVKRKGIRYAEDYLHPVPPPQSVLGVEPAGLEPATSALQRPRSSN